MCWCDICRDISVREESNPTGFRSLKSTRVNASNVGELTVKEAINWEGVLIENEKSKETRKVIHRIKSNPH